MPKAYVLSRAALELMPAPRGTCEGGVEAFYGNTKSHHLTANTEDVASPCGRGALLVVQAELCVVLEVDGVSTNVASAIGLNLSNDALLYGSGEYEAIVVVGMFTNKVDAARGSIYVACCAVEVFDETTSYVVDSKFHNVISPSP